MSESKTVYVNIDFVSCSKCGLCLGHYVTEGREIWLQMGMVRASAVHGKCASCNTNFHFTASEKKLEDLLKHLANGV